jgi:two-component system sensor histidine kinase DegS
VADERPDENEAPGGTTTDDAAEPAEDGTDGPAPGAPDPAAGAPDARPPEGPLTALAARARADVATLDRELAEIDMLVQQASSEAARHEAKRAQAAERIGAVAGRGDPRELAEANAQLLTLTRRTTVMDAQVEVLTGKQKVLRRYRDSLEAYAGELDSLARSGIDLRATRAAAEANAVAAADHAASPAVSRLVLGAQEDLRRDIARAMHDGPAQGLTNIVLQAQIVDRLMSRDADAANRELRQLVAMVQATLEATKTFIFDVRPMVLDDLGLVPTLRRAAHERGHAAGIPVDFDSTGADRRLSMELESGLFRMVDEAVVGFLGGRPDRVAVRLDWSEGLEATVVAQRTGTEQGAPAPKEKKGHFGRGKEKEGDQLPPALASMIEEQRVAAALASAPTPLPVNVWRAIQERAATIGVASVLSPDGAELSLSAALPPLR